jgi:hypothetical protein
MNPMIFVVVLCYFEGVFMAFFFKCFLAVVQEERKCLEFSANERDSFLICECNISCTCFMICSHDCALSKLFLVVILCNVLFKMIIENLIKKSC